MKTIIKSIVLILLVLPLLFTCKNDDSNGYTSNDENHISNLPPLKNHFTGRFLIGNIFNPNDISGSALSNPLLIRHFNVLTCENHMKPGYLAPSKGSYNFGNADRMVNAARAAGIKVVGHTLLWHSQNASWMNSSVTLAEMENYITAVVGHFKGRIHSWDVLNEVFTDGGSYRTQNPWYNAIGKDFVYYGFLAARKADSKAILYYNDYNTDIPTKAAAIRDMVRDVNNRYKSEFGVSRLLIEGIGMQEHHNLGVSASAIRNTLNLFKPLGVKISVSELDVLSQSWQDYSSNRAITEEGRAKQAELYGEYMKVYLEFRSIIERVSLWGVSDNLSWRARGEPLLFDRNGIAKPAYYSFIGAL